eukprot:1181927-Prorocentrum_minimum.AAC.2
MLARTHVDVYSCDLPLLQWGLASMHRLAASRAPSGSPALSNAREQLLHEGCGRENMSIGAMRHTRGRTACRERPST